MTRIFLACVALMAMVGPASAGSADADGWVDEAMQRLLDMKCAAQASLATSAMTRRQRGEPLEQVLGTEPSELWRELVLKAYKSPRWADEWDDEGLRRSAIEAFGNIAAAACYKREAEEGR